jgi:hypothetical protein
MAEAAYATGPAHLGAPRLPSSILFPNFLFPVSARGQNSAPVRGPKDPKSPRKREAPKVGPQTFFVPCFSARPKEHEVPRKRQASKFKNRGPNVRSSKRCSLFQRGIQTARGPKIKSARPQSIKSEAPKAEPQTKFFWGKGSKKRDQKHHRVQKISKFAVNC